MNFNTQVNKTQTDLINIINNSGLPIAVIRLILESMLIEAKNVEKATLEQETTETTEDSEQTEKNN